MCTVLDICRIKYNVPCGTTWRFMASSAFVRYSVNDLIPWYIGNRTRIACIALFLQVLPSPPSRGWTCRRVLEKPKDEGCFSKIVNPYYLSRLWKLPVLPFPLARSSCQPCPVICPLRILITGATIPYPILPISMNSPRQIRRTHAKSQDSSQDLWQKHQQGPST